MRIAIVGGSLAGALLALQLRDSEHQISIFDPRAPWEKPCGGAVNAEVFRQFPILGELRCSWHCPSKLKFLPSAREESFLLGPQSTWLMVSRYDLNRVILEVALRSRTVSLTAERVNDIYLTRDGSRWLVQTACGCQEFDVVVGADGVNSVVRKRLMGPIPREHLAVTVGYMVSDVPLDEMLFQTYSDLLGYLWYLPRPDHVSVGIVTRVNAVPFSELWRRLDGFLSRYYPQARKVRRWRALIPTAIRPDFWRQRCAGQNWALIGDAAGHVDPVTGIGIPYALASSTLVARAILCGDLESYDHAWREQYGDRLEQSSRIMERFVRTGDVAGFERGMEETCLATICPWLSALVK
ncbi:MAG: NAD(P)/FAD-dependent oxidoreductase [Thermodesulfobacteriota bacterium]|jgi:flavin-dependent dehydrogenase